MEVIVLPTATETAALAADIIETLLRTKADPGWLGGSLEG